MKDQRQQGNEHDAAAQTGKRSQQTGNKRVGEDQSGKEQQRHRLG